MKPHDFLIFENWCRKLERADDFVKKQEEKAEFRNLCQMLRTSEVMQLFQLGPSEQQVVPDQKNKFDLVLLF